MNRRLKVFLGSGIVSGLLILGYATYDRGALPGMNPTPVETPFTALSLDNRGVRVKGTAHYPVQLQMSGGLPGDGPVYIFPLFGPGDTTGKEVRLLVLSHQRPDPMLGFEDRTIEGLIRPSINRVPQGVRDQLTMLGYRFADEVLVLLDFANPPTSASTGG